MLEDVLKGGTGGGGYLGVFVESDGCTKRLYVFVFVCLFKDTSSSLIPSLGTSLPPARAQSSLFATGCPPHLADCSH